MVILCGKELKALQTNGSSKDRDECKDDDAENVFSVQNRCALGYACTITMDPHRDCVQPLF